MQLTHKKQPPTFQRRGIAEDSLLPSSTTPIKPMHVETKHTRTMGDIFVQHSQKLELFRNVFRNVAELDALEGLNMIDAVQRLGIDYHFQQEIDEILHNQMSIVSACDDLHEVALRFRLLRQHGYFVPEDVFNNFKNSKGKFKQVLGEDIKGLMSLYEASARWWKDLGLAKELKLARDQPLKWYILSMACLTDPKLSEERVELTKLISFVCLIDDIFDVYGTLDELILFTESVNRWEITAIDHLPDNMKICFRALYDITNEISCKVYLKHGWNPLQSLKISWASLCNAFLVEAKWFASGQLPKSEEYLKNGIVSSGVNVGLVHLFFLLGQNITRKSVELLNETPAIISSSAAILRLWNDLGSAKDENKDGNDGSYVRCYLEEHEGCSIEEAREKTINMISDEWKKLNRELLSPNPFPATFTSASLNLARMIPLMYIYDGNQSLPSLKEYMKLMLYEN
ncbi:hypothetical protein ACLB2K_024774 [Fragaria x ananassa]